MFIMEIMEKIPDGHKMVSFDIISPFTRVPLDETIEIILKKAYIEKKIKTYIMKSILKELLCICTKQVHFTFNDQTVQLGSPLGFLLPNIFMSSLEEEVLTGPSSCLCIWKRYVDDIHMYIAPGKVQFTLNNLDLFYPNIQFTFELEKSNTITFLMSL